MSPLRGRDGHLYLNADDSEAGGPCVRCGRPKAEHDVLRFSAGYMTITRSRLAQELAPNGLAMRLLGGDRDA